MRPPNCHVRDLGAGNMHNLDKMMPPNCHFRHSAAGNMHNLDKMMYLVKHNMFVFASKNDVLPRRDDVLSLNVSVCLVKTTCSHLFQNIAFYLGETTASEFPLNVSFYQVDTQHACICFKT